VYSKVTTTCEVVSGFLQNGRDNKAETSVTMEDAAETARSLISLLLTNQKLGVLTNQTVLDPKVHCHTSRVPRTHVTPDVGCRSANKATDPQAGAGNIPSKRKQQIVKSDALFFHLAQIIDAD
jgi:hypothetical protein